MICLDRFENDLAVLETDNGMVQIPRSQLSPQAKEGDLLVQTTDGYVVDAAATQARRKAMLDRTRRLQKK